MRVIIAEDIVMWRELFVKTCRAHCHCVVGETASAVETVKLCREHRPDALLLDVRLEDGDGLEAARILRGDGGTAKIKIIVLTVYTLPNHIHRISQAPVDGCVDKNVENCGAIADALVAVAHGKKWFSPNFLRTRQQQNNDPDFFGKLLGPREVAILSLIAQGFSDEEIAAQFGISRRTVEGHRSHLMHKLHIDDMRSLMAFAVANGFT